MIGSCSPKMLELTARYAEQWNAFYDDTRNSVEEARRLKEVVDAACLAAGRDPATLERTVTVLVAPPGAPPGAASGMASHWGALPLTGSAEEMAAELLRYETAGVSHIQLWLEDATPAGMRAGGRAVGLTGFPTNNLDHVAWYLRGPGVSAYVALRSIA